MDQPTVISVKRSNAQLFGETLIHERSTHNQRAYLLAKIIIEIIASFSAIILLSPFLLLIALIIFMDDPKGSPIFVQKRCGRNGKLFNFYKFRSMFIDAETKLSELKEKNEMSGPVFKIKNDPRITRVGKFIRKTSIDELPQLFNVLKGDMSVVGPRPPLPREVEQYSEKQFRRLSVKPGLTCFWQVTPRRNSLSFEEWVDLDMKYIREQNLLIDFMLVLRTIATMFMGEGV